MAKEFKLPELGENIESADVLSVLVKAGDKIEKEQSVIEIETDKATVEVPSEIAGKIKEVKVKEGDNVKVGQTLLIFENGGEESEESSEKSEEKKPEKKKSEEKAGKKETEDSKKDEEEKDDKKSEKKEEEKAEQKSEKKTKQKSAGGVVEVKVPDLGENIESADIVSVLVSKGDKLEKDQGIIEIETDKATVEVPSEVSGKIIEVLVNDGDKIKVGQTILKVESSEEAEADETEEEEEKLEEKEEKKEDKKKEEPEEDESEEKSKPKGETEKMLPGEVDDQPPIRKDAAPAAPSVRRIAREIGIRIQDVPGSGSGGRISMDDVKAYAKKLNEGRTSGGAGENLGIKKEKLPDFSKFGDVEVKSMSKIRTVTAEHLGYAWAVIPHVTQHDKADITELEKIRKQYNPKIEKAGGKLTVTSILLKILTAGMKVYPQFNSSIDMDKKEIIYKKYFHIGVAVDTEQGLIVPVIRNVDKKNLTELSVELNSLAEKARIRKISLDDLSGGCMTITNLGGIGGTSFTPIVNSPEVAILGVSRGSFEPVYNKEAGEFEPRLMLPLSLSYDHRIIDGADAARFLRWICEALEQPIKLLMEG